MKAVPARFVRVYYVCRVMTLLGEMFSECILTTKQFVMVCDSILS